MAIRSRYTTTITYHTTSTHMAAATAANCTHLSLATTIGIPSPTTTTISSTTYFAQSNRHCTNLRHSVHLDVCATISNATATHTPNSSTFPFIHFATTTSYTTC